MLWEDRVPYYKQQVEGCGAWACCMQVCCAVRHSHKITCRLPYQTPPLCPTHQDPHTSQQHPLPAAGIHLLQRIDFLTWQTLNYQLVQLRPAVYMCAEVGCWVSATYTWRQGRRHKEDGHTSPWEEGELLQITTSVQGGLVHLQHT